MRKLFISYAHKDTDAKMLCKQLVEFLSPDYQIWYDEHISAGQIWGTNIAQRLQSCDAIICLVSPNWLKSEYCNREYDIAFFKNKIILPFKITEVSNLDDEKIAATFRSIQCEDISNHINSDGFMPVAVVKILRAIDQAFKSSVGHPQVLTSPNPNSFEWCEVPEGETILLHSDGSTTVQKVSEFKIIKYPIKISQYKSFLADGGGYDYRDLWHFNDSAYRWRLKGEKTKLEDSENQPVTQISWFDIIAYCDWLSLTLAYPEKKQISLPSELQLQRAVLLANPSIYTTPSLQEWCSNDYNSPTTNFRSNSNIQPTVRAMPLLDTSNSPLPHSRLHRSPDDLSKDVGFRLVDLSQK